MPRRWGVGLTILLGMIAPGFPLAFAADAGFPAYLVAITAATAVIWLYFIVRAARMRLVADETGLVIANYLRTVRLRWSDVGRLSSGLVSTMWQARDVLRFGL